MEQATRNKLRNVVTQCRKLLEVSIAQQLQGQFGIHANQKDTVEIEDDARMSHLSEEDQQYRHDLLDHLEHIKARGFNAKDALDQLIREVAFTHLNRLCAYKMMESRDVYVGGKKFREAVSRGIRSNGFLMYLGTEGHEEDERLYQTGQQEIAYRHFLDWLGGMLSEEIGVLFSPNDPANRLYPRQKTVDELLELLNDEQLTGIWEQDETIGWVYQYFTPSELRVQVRKESSAPRNTYELAFRNQFFTPRYVVEFLTDNTLGRLWYEMRRGETKLKDHCRYMVRRLNEVFLKDGQDHPSETPDSQEELLTQPVYVPHRPKKDPRELKILDPASGSGHFLLYCFDLMLTIYEEAYTDPDLGPRLQQDYETYDDLLRDVPRLILTCNLHGIDIDLRATQIAALALWLRCQRAYLEMERRKDRPKITRSNFVCAEPMPGEEQMLKEFLGQLEPRLLGQLVEVVFDKMKLAGEAGSLLKIEEEVRDAVARAKDEWLTGPVTVQRSLFDIDEPRNHQQQFDFSGIGDAEFFEQAESKVVDTLRSYAEHTQSDRKLQRRLFAEDAMRGFAFVDLCHKRFDVVLMNPPFGLFTESALSYAKAEYPNASNDFYAAFVQRALNISDSRGFVGVISSRLGFFLEGLEKWRQPLLGGECGIDTVADLGYGVLDALVETAAYTLRMRPHLPTITALGALSALDKQQVLATQIQACHKGKEIEGLFSLPLSLFKSLPSSVVAYWLPPHFANTLLKLPTLAESGVSVFSGLQTDDNFRFVRLWWEIPQAQQHRWMPFAKGGDYQPYADDLHLTVDWANDGAELKEFVASKYRHWSRHIKNTDRFFQAGLTYSERTTSDLSVRAFPAGSIFSVKGPVVQSETQDDLLLAWAVLSSRAGRAIIEIGIGSGDTSQSGTAARDYRTGIIANVPFPNFSTSQRTGLKDAVLGLFHANLAKQTRSETHRLYVRRKYDCTSIRQRSEALAVEHIELFLSATHHSEKLEDTIDDSLGLTDGTESTQIAGPHPARQEVTNVDAEITDCVLELLNLDESALCSRALSETPYSRNATKKTFYFDRKLELFSLITSLRAYELVDVLRGHITQFGNTFRDVITKDDMSYAVGCVFGRWSVERMSDGRSDADLIDPFGKLPQCSPAMLQGPCGTPLSNTPKDYPIAVDWDGILADDSEHQDDIVRRLRAVFEVMWKDRAESVETETCEILKLKRLRDYFRKPGKGGFWDDHIRRYSKSRRKAPIYWLLQSSKRNYGLWLYYHRLDKDMLFKALLNYVEPKIQREDNRLGELRSQKSSIGESGSGSKKLERNIEKQEDLLSELRDFEEKLRSVAELHLIPDLNDGVVLNIAPLHELVPWKEAQKYWKQLLDGKYEWSSVGKQLREKGLVK